MDEVIAQAGRLGAAIAAHERCQALKAAQKAFLDCAEAQQIHREYEEAANLLSEKAQAGQPLEPEEKRREAELRRKMAEHPVIREVVRRQADFRELMESVHEALDREIALP